VKSLAGEDRASCAAVFGVGAFTGRPFGGNPAMVFLLPEPAGGEWMQRAAAELNQPATAFLHGRRLRWFTPAVELPLCGHATVAAAHVLYEAGLIAPADPIVFETAPGPLRAWRQDGLIWIGFAPVAVQEARAPAPLSRPSTFRAPAGSAATRTSPSSRSTPPARLRPSGPTWNESAARQSDASW